MQLLKHPIVVIEPHTPGTPETRFIRFRFQSEAREDLAVVDVDPATAARIAENLASVVTR